MKRTIFKQAIAATSALLLLLFALPACSDGDEPAVPETRTAKLNIRLGVFGGSRSAYTKASFEPDAEEADAYERAIDDWYVVILKNDGTIERVLSNRKNDVATAAGDDDNTHAVSGVELVVGETYRFYAFANLLSLSDKGAADYLLGLTEGQPFELAKAVSLKPVADYRIPAAGTKASAYIPMSSYAETATVQESGAQVKILLIRLLGKVEVSINNATGTDLILKSLSLGTFRTGGDIYLLPYDAARGETTRNLLATSYENSYAPSFPTGTPTYTVMSFVKETPVKIAATGENPVYRSFANETSFLEANDTKALRITADIEGRNSRPLETEFDFIRRNDWLEIPLLISDIETGIAFEMRHMPIGGLPTTITMPEGVSLPVATYCTQDHGGEIKITYTLSRVNSLQYAKIKHYASGSSWEGGNAHPFTSAVLKSSSKLLIDLPKDNTAAPWLTGKGVQAYPLTAGSDGMSGSFTVTAQELADSAEASIDLTLVIEGMAGGETKTLVVPYTIILKNKNPKGGNS